MKAANMKKEPARKSKPSLAITKQQTHSPFLAPPLIQREHFRVSIDDGAFSSQGRKFDLRTRLLTQTSPIPNPNSSKTKRKQAAVTKNLSNYIPNRFVAVFSTNSIRRLKFFNLGVGIEAFGFKATKALDMSLSWSSNSSARFTGPPTDMLCHCKISGSSTTMLVLSLSQVPLLNFRGNNEARDMKAELQGQMQIKLALQYPALIRYCRGKFKGGGCKLGNEGLRTMLVLMLGGAIGEDIGPLCCNLTHLVHIHRQIQPVANSFCPEGSLAHQLASKWISLEWASPALPISFHR
ncbi:hypothetical protein SADUNF_Sadunf10G0181800 [Salix dunnii]|uniref:Uncharacterized protein n=1 Tax=Salix dunnii TaxID=1413687 RepID=A0A835JUT3_9ROSI|nr:hypothetical protein SADUNF_Sadunf10G0181800 [Salix dunnii]